MNQSRTRRTFLQGAAAVAGTLGAGRLLGGRAIRRAAAATRPEDRALIVVHTHGGCNAMFASADAFLENGGFGVTSSNVLRVGTSDVYVDKGSLGLLPAA